GPDASGPRSVSRVRAVRGRLELIGRGRRGRGTMRPVSQEHPGRVDALVVGAGPAGAAAAFWLAERGHSVLAVDKKVFPREKTCGDGLTPRGVRQLLDMGLADPLRDFHRYDGLRSIAHGITLELAGPGPPGLPAHGSAVRRA